jgi:hypothetical protein
MIESQSRVSAETTVRLALRPDMRADMTLYYFHLRDGVDILIDEEGRQLESLASVAEAALAEARSIISADAESGHIRLDQRIDVEDETRTIVHTLEFADAVTIDPAAMRERPLR